MLAALVLTLLVVVFRVVLGVWGMPDTPAWQWAHNFSPLAAVALCGAALFPRRVALALPLGALLLSDLIMNAHYRVGLLSMEMLPRYLALLAVARIGLALRRAPRLGTMLLGSLAGSVLFYVVSNTGAWFGNPIYAQSFGGWVQALTVGVPGYTPSLYFFRNSLVSDLLFTALFVGCVAVRPRAGAGLEPAAQPAN